MSKKENVAKLSVLSNSLLIVLKFIVGTITGSVSIISEAIHSIMDLIAAVIAFFSVKIADRPPDEDHPYGHEKVENISGVIEAALIIVAALFIIIEAVKKIANNEPVENLGWAIGVMFVSATVNMVVSKRLYKVAEEEDSVALAADALHLKTDVYTSAGVGAGLLVMFVLKLLFGDSYPWINYLDPIIAICVAVFILFEAFEMLKEAFNPLMDKQLSKDDVEAIKSVLWTQQEVYIDFHEVRTRKSGKTKHIDFHLTVPQQMTVKESHDICDKLEKEIEHKLRNTKVLIHIEPCDCDCEKCKMRNFYKFCRI